MGQQRVRHNRATWAMALVNWHLRVYRMVRYEPADSGLGALDVSSLGASAKEAPQMPVLLNGSKLHSGVPTSMPEHSDSGPGRSIRAPLQVATCHSA